jgi:hypothetical protein
MAFQLPQLPQRLAAKLFSFGRQSPPLVIIEPEASVTHPFSKDAILLDQICDDLLLVLGHPAGNRRYDKRKWVQRCARISRYYGRYSRKISIQHYGVAFRLS